MTDPLPRIRKPLTNEDWRRLRINGRDSDQSSVIDRAFISLRLGITPVEERILTSEAQRRGLSKAAVIRAAIRKFEEPA